MHHCSIWCYWHVEPSELVPAICCEFVFFYRGNLTRVADAALAVHNSEWVHGLSPMGPISCSIDVSALPWLSLSLSASSNV